MKTDASDVTQKSSTSFPSFNSCASSSGRRPAQNRSDASEGDLFTHAAPGARDGQFGNASWQAAPPPPYTEIAPSNHWSGGTSSAKPATNKPVARNVEDLADEHLEHPGIYGDGDADVKRKLSPERFASAHALVSSFESSDAFLRFLRSHEYIDSPHLLLSAPAPEPRFRGHPSKELILAALEQFPFNPYREFDPAQSSARVYPTAELHMHLAQKYRPDATLPPELADTLVGAFRVGGTEAVDVASKINAPRVVRRADVAEALAGRLAGNKKALKSVASTFSQKGWGPMPEALTRARRKANRLF